MVQSHMFKAIFSFKDAKENRYFREYVDNIQKTFSLSELSYFEMNLETWRQLWRVLEMSDILLVIVDARFPVSHSTLNLLPNF